MLFRSNTAPTTALALIQESMTQHSAHMARIIRSMGREFSILFEITRDYFSQEDYAIVTGDDEADIKRGMISISSPFARALIGKYAGDTATVQAPGGNREFEIVDVRYV